MGSEFIQLTDAAPPARRRLGSHLHRRAILRYRRRMVRGWLAIVLVVAFLSAGCAAKTPGGATGKAVVGGIVGVVGVTGGIAGTVVAFGKCGEFEPRL